MSSTRFGKKKFFARHLFFLSKKLVFEPYLGCFWHYRPFIYMFGESTNFFIALSVRRVSCGHFKLSFSSLGQTNLEIFNFILVRLWFLSLFRGCFLTLYAIYVYVTLANYFFVALYVRGVSSRHFKPCFSSLGQTSWEGINFI